MSETRTLTVAELGRAVASLERAEQTIARLESQLRDATAERDALADAVKSYQGTVTEDRWIAALTADLERYRNHAASDSHQSILVDAQTLEGWAQQSGAIGELMLARRKKIAALAAASPAVADDTRQEDQG